MMNTFRKHKSFVIGLFVLLFILISTSSGSAQPPADTVSIQITVPKVQLSTASSAFAEFEIEGYHAVGRSGDPLLPARIIDIALPPDVIPQSIQANVTEIALENLSGTFNIAPAPPLETWIDGQKIEDWGANELTIVNGRNTAVYDQDAFFPQQAVEFSNFSQMRKYRFARVMIYPLSFNPVSGQVRLAKEITFEIQFERQARKTSDRAQFQLEMNDTLMDGRAAEKFFNFAQAQPWYAPRSAGGSVVGEQKPAYIIITRNAIASASRKLAGFVTHKRELGFEVQVITEDEYGSLKGQAPNGSAEKIRQWLINNYLPLNIQYVLLIGNPDPDDPEEDDQVGDIPMKIVIPAGYFEEIIYRVPTDYLYADLTGNWDLNGDLHYGDIPDREPGGVDLEAEVYVGRIPVYRNVSGWRSRLDSILQKMIAYETSADVSWRSSALLPMAFMDEYADEAPMAELMKANYLHDLGFSTYTMYEQGDRGPEYDSIYASDEPLVYPGVRNLWQDHPYGLVIWSTHGWQRGASLVITSEEAAYLNDSRPALTFQLSCNNGWPEDEQNLGFALLRQGAVGTVSASRVSWGFYNEPNPLGGSNTDHAYYYAKRLAKNWPAGKALYTTKAQFYGFGWLENRTVYNLYGDPALNLKGPDNTIFPDKTTYISSDSAGSISGIDYTPGDILRLDEEGGWALLFDASDIGLDSSANVSAFTFHDDGTLLMSFAEIVNLPGLSEAVTPWEVVRFRPVHLGENTAGLFERCPLSPLQALSSPGEQVDALHFAGNNLYLSTVGDYTIEQGMFSLAGSGEDILEYNPQDQVCDGTNGSWDSYLYNSSAQIEGLAGENVQSLWIDENSQPYISLAGDFTIMGTSGHRWDILKLQREGYTDYSGAQIFWHGPDDGYSDAIDGLHIGAVNDPPPISQVTICVDPWPEIGNSFEFSGDLGEFVLSKPGSDCHTFNALTAGEYYIKHDLEDSWYSEIACSESVGDGHSQFHLDFDTTTAGLTINLAERSVVSCTFRNLYDPYEPNNSPAEVVPIPFNEPIAAAIFYLYPDYNIDKDYYQFAITAGRVVSATVDIGDGGLLPYLCLTGEDGDDLGCDFSDPQSPFVRTIPATGTYILSLEGWGSEGGYGESGPYSLLLTHDNNRPLSFEDSYALNAATTLVVNAPGVLANDHDEDGDPLTLILHTDVLHGDLDLTDGGGFTYTPHSGYIGADSFYYQVSDGLEQSEPVIVRLAVRPQMIFMPLVHGG